MTAVQSAQERAKAEEKRSRLQDQMRESQLTRRSRLHFNQLTTPQQFMMLSLMTGMSVLDTGNSSHTSTIGAVSAGLGLSAAGGRFTQFNDLKNQIGLFGLDAVRDTRDFSNANFNTAQKAFRQSAVVMSESMPSDLNERQQRVVAVMNDAAASANVSPKMMVGLWGMESRYGTSLRSPTGCQGDFQFTRSTMAETIARHGDTIAARLRAQGFPADADTVEQIHRRTEHMNGKQLTAFADTNKGVIDTLRNSPEIATYAAAYYTKSIAHSLRLDPHASQNFGYIYAGYNIGVGHARHIMSGQAASGWEVDVNRAAAGHGTSAAEQKSAYDNAIHRNMNSTMGQAILNNLAITNNDPYYRPTASASAAGLYDPKGNLKIESAPVARNAFVAPASGFDYAAPSTRRPTMDHAPSHTPS